MPKGFIYILSNPSFANGQIKIGQSMNDPSFRKDKLNTTGLPEPFVIEYFAFVDDYDDVELRVHSKLSDYRPNNSREFFNCSIPEAVLVIREMSTVNYEEIFYKSPEEIRELEEEKKRQELKRQLEVEQEAKEEEKESQRREKQINLDLQKKQENKTKERQKDLKFMMKVAFWLFIIMFILTLPAFMYTAYENYLEKKLILLEEINNSLEIKKN